MLWGSVGLNGNLHWPLRRPYTPVGVIAHRGSARFHKENTLEAFTLALESGADGVELDVRRTADGVAVVHHDPEVPGAGPLHTLRAGDLPAWVPTLEAALAACAGAAVDVEVKNVPSEPGFDPDEALAGEVAELVAAVTGSPGGPAATIVSSFWPATLAAALAARSGLATGLLAHPAVDVEACLEGALALGCTTLLPFRDRVSPELVEAAHSRGLAVVVWTVNEDADFARAAQAGADAVVTDLVPAALEALGRS